MKTGARDSVRSLALQWQDERLEMDHFFCDIRQWMDEVGQLGVPHFGETADRLRCFRQRLVAHFDREAQIAAQVARSQRASASAIEAARGEAHSEHDELQQQLDDLITRLAALDPPFDSWQEAMRELENFIGALDRHEDWEAENIEWLKPAASGLGASEKKTTKRRAR